MSVQSFGQILSLRAESHPDRGYVYLVDGEREEVALSFSELERRARAVGRVLHERGLRGEQVLLLFPPGLEFIAALFGCFVSGAVAVPLAPPNPKRIQDELRRMAVLTRDSRARAVLTTRMFHTIFQSLPDTDPAFSSIEFLLIEEALEAPAEPASGWQPAPIKSDQLAFLQYTSGSTGTPKGVMVTHGNLLENAAFLKRASGHDESTFGVSWLPMFHDFGLIGCVLQPMFIAASCVFLSPLAFLQRPARWLSAISRYRAQGSGAPNFAFELCVRKITEEECASFDLSSWQIAHCAAEPVRKETMERFTRRFAPYGFRPTTLWPCYGLAESTLFSTGGPLGRGVVARDFSSRAFEEGRACAARPGDKDTDRRTLVALGNSDGGGSLAIVSVDTGAQCGEGEVGEIWLSGPSVTAGYFGRPEETERVFRATLPSFPGRNFLRTGDLGFVQDGELFMTGRLKDLLIIRGRNLYPQDLEQTVESVSPAIRAGCTAAFSIESNGESNGESSGESSGEVPVIVAELTPSTGAADAASIGAAIRQAVSERHGLALHALCLVPPQSVPKTSSGKLQRSKCRAEYLSGRLQPLWQWTAPVSAPAPTPPAAAAKSRRRGEDALAWLTTRLHSLVQAADASFDPESPLASYGLDSARLVGLSGELAEQLGEPLAPTFFYDHPTLSAVARFLRKQPTMTPLAIEVPAAAEPIAIVGIGCRFPGGVDSPEAFFRLLSEGRDAITEVPPERWNLAAWYSPDPDASGKMNTRWGGFLQGLENFDPSFFQLSPREAPSIDPQERLLLETSWEALERAGIVPAELLGTQTGVFMGLCGSEYLVRAMSDPARIDPYSLLGTAHSAMVGRLSYWLGLQGPNLSIDTACSSSLVAIHLACQALRAGECSLALAGGAHVVLSPESTVAFSRLRALSPTGHCRAFSADADGYVRSEGAGVLVLERLSDARRSGHPVLALIRGSAVNQDGRSNGLTAPSGPAQTAVIREALRRGGVDPESVDYLECHGTGTPLGDPIEVQAAAAALRNGRTAAAPLVLGSVKTNIGHTEAAAGVAGVIKSVLALAEERIPKNLYFKAPNPHIPWSSLPVQVAKEAMPWPRSNSGRPRRAGVSSFGFSGTNAHVVLEEAPSQQQPPAPQRAAELIILSAQSEAALSSQAAKLRTYLQEQAEPTLGDVAFSLATTRSAMARRLALAATTRTELLAQLDAAARGQTPPRGSRGRVRTDGARKVVFVFPGQGSQWLGMGCSLFAEEPVFREALTACDRAIFAEAGFSVIAELHAAEAVSELARIDVVQPVLFALGVALCSLWRSFGVEPDAVVGHSLGEIAAAHVAGILSLSDAVAIVCRRSRLLRSITGLGEMALVECSHADAERALLGYEDRLSVAVSNGPRSTVIAGDPGALASVLSQLEARGVFCRRVKVDVASHSAQVEPLLKELLQELSGIQPQLLSIPMISTVSCELLRGPELGAEYWARNLRQPVRFGQAVKELLASGHVLFAEMSPHPLLVPAIEAILQDEGRDGAVVGSLRRGQAERAELLRSLGVLWTQGCAVDWEKQFHAGGQRVPLPTYPWQRQRYWLDAPADSGSSGARRARTGGHPILGTGQLLSTHIDTRIWEANLDSQRLPWLADHRVQGAVVLAGAAYLEMALASAAESFGADPFLVTELVLPEVLLLPSDGGLAAQVVATEEQPGQLRWQVASRHRGAGAPFSVHARAMLRRSERAELPPRVDLAALRARMNETEPQDVLYAEMAAMGLEYGPAFRGLRALSRGNDEALARIELNEAAGSAAGYLFHPAFLDACLHAVAGCLRDPGEGAPWIPVALDRLRPIKRPAGSLFCHVQLLPIDAATPERRHADLCVTDDAGEVVAELGGLTLQRLSNRREEERDRWYLGVEWDTAQVPEPRLTGGRWLLLGGEGLADALRIALEEKGHTVAQAKELPRSTMAMTELLARCFDEQPPTAVVHLGSLDSTEGGVDPSLEDGLIQRCESVLVTAQAMVALKHRDVPRLWLLTRGAQAIENREIALSQAPVLGLSRTIAMEHAELRCARIDLDPRRPADEANAVLAELLADDDDDEIALRSGQRYVARLDRRPRESGARTNGRPPIRRDSSYLISGGLGGLGLSVAGWLAAQGAGHLILLGRTGAQSAEQQSAVAALREGGTRVTVAHADVAEREQVATIVREVSSTGMPLRGVVHAAGVLDDAMLIGQTSEKLRRVMRPKAQGALNLHELTADLKLDFFILYASAAGLLGSPGQANYAAANTFLDALAHHRKAQGLPALSIDWGAFSGTGLAAAQDDRGARLAARGLRSLTPQEGLHALERLFAEDAAQVGVVPLNVRQWGVFHQVTAASRRLSRLRKEEAAQAGRNAGDRELIAQLSAADPAARASLLADVLRREAAQILRLDERELELDAPLSGLGMDSLMGLELRNRIEARLGIRVLATLLWTYPTLAALSRQLADSVVGTESTRKPARVKKQDEDAQGAKPLVQEAELFAALDESLARAAQKVL